MADPVAPESLDQTFQIWKDGADAFFAQQAAVQIKTIVLGAGRPSEAHPAVHWDKRVQLVSHLRAANAANLVTMPEELFEKDERYAALGLLAAEEVQLSLADRVVALVPPELGIKGVRVEIFAMPLIVSKLLLVRPAGDLPEDLVNAGIREYTGPTLIYEVAQYDGLVDICAWVAVQIDRLRAQRHLATWRSAQHALGST